MTATTTHTSSETRLAQRIARAAQPLARTPQSYDALLDLIGDSRFVLLGEASHGTHDFYAERAEITKRLIVEKQLTAVAVEADWPDAYRVNRYVRGESDDPDGRAALGDFQRFPTWMWRNTVVLEFVEWLREHNARLPRGAPKVGFYGMDLYSLNSSVEAVIQYLEKVDPEGARRARERYACFERFEKDTQAYGYAASSGAIDPCEDEVIAQLVELQRRASELAGRDGRAAADEFFYAEQNARLAKNAEEYYRAMFRGRNTSWNLRDSHMVETLGELVDHLHHQGVIAKVAVWAHNSHLGDARATEMGRGGELNVGQLVRQRWDRDSFLIGFTTYTGAVTAAQDWDEPPRHRKVRPGLAGSYEALFHDVAQQLGQDRFFLPLRPGSGPGSPSDGSHNDVLDDLRRERLERAIGVIYRPETERWSHYFHASLADQFDAVLHLDETRAVEPLERTAGWDHGGAPDTFPSGV
ncbi:MAG: Erythromycin esterase homolog [uncultured Chloroflexi bacterium]|uniref:Erythromycin esterase homolog n=1 Tax=uncultured Chloroflexota bacterium TaxID=166587 RepID=A0A6J4IW02_9CHLR|nr:MAG: Erythromycin esterase homolog [uncultured Chloroflexota bacterium]